MNRRTFLQTASAAALATGRAGAVAPSSRIVDTHTHFYDPTREVGVPWPGKGSPLYRPVYPKDWKAVAAPLGVGETVVVEASQRVEDNQWILDLAAKDKSIVGFIGNLDPTDAAFSQNLKRFAANPLFKGIRWRGDLVKVDSADAGVKRCAKELAEHGLVLELNGRAAMLKDAARLAREIPDLRIMIDHVGGAGDPSQLSDEWKLGMKEAGALKNVFCKVSALQEQTGESTKKWGSAPRDVDYYLPILDHCVQCFGDERLVYGSNWPVAEKGGSYADQFKLVSDYFGGKGREIAERYFWKNAKAVYRF